MIGFRRVQSPEWGPVRTWSVIQDRPRRLDTEYITRDVGGIGGEKNEHSSMFFPCNADEACFFVVLPCPTEFCFSCLVFRVRFAPDRCSERASSGQTDSKRPGRAPGPKRGHSLRPACWLRVVHRHFYALHDMFWDTLTAANLFMGYMLFG